MKKLLVAVALFSLLALPAFAQETPAFEVFGGYSLQNIREGVNETGHGFALAGEGNLSDMFGIVGEFGFYDYDGGKAYTFMAGPRVGYRAEKIRPFAHILFGGTNFKEDNASGDTYFSLSVGGGLDVVVNEMISIRPVQFDYSPIRVTDGDYSQYMNTIRYSAGVVLTF